MSGGRPKGSNTFTTKTGEAICIRLAEGASLRSICEAKGFPAESTVRLWVLQNINPEFTAQYVRARELQAEKWADEIVDIADDGSNDYIERTRPDGSTFEAVNSEHINRSRLRVDTRKWMLSKMLPKKYGERVVNEMVGKDGGPIRTESVNDTDRARALAEFMAKTTHGKPSGT